MGSYFSDKSGSKCFPREAIIFTSGRKEAPAIFAEGYYYGMNKMGRQFGRYWRCTKHNVCNVRAFLNVDKSFTVKGKHNHSPKEFK